MNVAITRELISDIYCTLYSLLYINSRIFCSVSKRSSSKIFLVTFHVSIITIKGNMDFVKILLVFPLFLCLSVSEKPDPSSIQINTSNTTFSEHKTTTTNTPISSSSKPTSTTTNSSSTIPVPTTSTPSSTTPVPITTLSPKPTTPVPITTISPKPTTTSTSTLVPTSTSVPTPTPAPVDPSTGNWALNYPNTNYTCLLIDAALQIELFLGNSTRKINVSVNSTADGTCYDTADVLNLKWDKNVVTINFTKNGTAKKFALEYIRVFINDTKNYTLVHQQPEFSTSLDHSYKCAKLQTLNLTDYNSNDTIAYLHISHAQFQAFSNVTGHHFYEAIDCETSSITSDVVPIVVGCVLAVLVVIVLVAYLYGRRRCQARGYLSM